MPYLNWLNLFCLSPHFSNHWQTLAGKTICFLNSDGLCYPLLPLSFARRLTLVWIPCLIGWCAKGLLCWATSTWSTFRNTEEYTGTGHQHQPASCLVEQRGGNGCFRNLCQPVWWVGDEQIDAWCTARQWSRKVGETKRCNLVFQIVCQHGFPTLLVTLTSMGLSTGQLAGDIGFRCGVSKRSQKKDWKGCRDCFRCCYQSIRERWVLRPPGLPYREPL